MIRFINIPASAVEAPPRVDRPAQAEKGISNATAAGADRVEFSREGLALARAVSDSTRRIMRIAAIRDEIRAGTYETTQRIDGAVDSILKLLAP